MTVPPSRSDAAYQSPEPCWSEDDDLRTAALELLQSSGFAALRRLCCEVTEAVVVVHGIVPSYYLKQVAQTLLLRLDGIRSVKNLVDVRQGNRSWPVLLADEAPSWDAPDVNAAQKRSVPRRCDGDWVEQATVEGLYHETV
jgi:hypothetical protein